MLEGDRQLHRKSLPCFAMSRYRLDELGAIQFEWICQTLLKKYCGLEVEAWGGHSDRGNDAFSKVGVRLPGVSGYLPGPVTFQVKFVSNANAVGSKPFGALSKAVSAEITKTKSRPAKDGLNAAGSYVLLSNTPLSVGSRLKIENQIREAFPKKKIVVQSADDLCSMLDDAPGIRVAYPQILGLRDLNELLEQVVDRTIINRSTLALSRARELASVFFPTNAYREALSKLEANGFVVLTGPPEMGKTAIARMIGLAKLSEGWRCLECRNPDEVLSKLGKQDVPTLFIADDAFGTTEYTPANAFSWAQELDSILRALDSKCWLIWTSRPAPLKLALEKMHLQGKAENFPDPGKILVDASEMTGTEKAMILFRHAKCAGLSEAAKDVLKKFADDIIENPHFTPDRVRKFVSSALGNISTSDAAAVKLSIKRAIEVPTDAMMKSFRSLDRKYQALLIAMLDAGSGEVAIDELTSALHRHNLNDLEIDVLINNLESHFLRRTEREFYTFS